MTDGIVDNYFGFPWARCCVSNEDPLKIPLVTASAGFG